MLFYSKSQEEKAYPVTRVHFFFSKDLYTKKTEGLFWNGETSFENWSNHILQAERPS